ncbi:MAG: hypothetical protein ACYTAU_19330 [Planctomycetota bacterium]
MQRIGLAYAAAGLKHRVVAFYLQDLDARRLHQLGGCRTTAQYAAHRFGMSRREARDLLAAGKALLESWSRWSSRPTSRSGSRRRCACTSTSSPSR